MKISRILTDIEFYRDSQIEQINEKKKGVPACSLTNFSRNSPFFPHSITNKEGGNDKSSIFRENNKRVRNHLFREMIPDKRSKTNTI